jgi:hypothetical protein
LAQIFPPWLNKHPIEVAIAGSVGPTLVIAGVWHDCSPWYTDAGHRPVQPEPRKRLANAEGTPAGDH